MTWGILSIRTNCIYLFISNDILYNSFKNFIAKLFKKAGMLEETNTVLSYDDYKYEIANAMRDAAKKANVPIGSTPALLDKQTAFFV